MDKGCFDQLTTKVSRLGFGCMRFPTIEGEGEKIDRVKSLEMIDYAYNHGTEYFDTAWGYHDEESQWFVGEALEKYPRESFYLATKMPFWKITKEGDQEYLFEEQLKRCRVDYFDYYLMHAMNKDHVATMEKFGTYEYMKAKKEAGIIKQLGFSYHGDMEALAYLLDNFEWDFVQLQINYFDVDYHMSNAKEEYELVKKHNLPIIVMEPVRGGFLANPPEKAKDAMIRYDANRSFAAWALRWCLAQENIELVLSGMSNMEQLVDNMETFSDFEEFSTEEQKVVEKVNEIIFSVDTVPCTACRYCMDCPFGVDIPGNFTLYNNLNIFDKPEGIKKQVSTLVEEKKGVSACTQCGVCVSKCPQNIQIPDELERIGTVLGKL